MFRLPAAVFAAIAFALAASPARAELWGYVDGRGAAHFADAPLDSRYQLVHGAAPDALRVPGKTDGAGSLLTWLEIAPEVKAVTPWVKAAAKRHGVDAELLTAVIAVESGFKADAVSRSGAVGLMQIMPQTADNYATPAERRVPAQERLRHPGTNIDTGARVLASLLKRFSSIDVALAAWNAGEGNVRRAGNKMPPYKETQAHVHMVLELYWALLQNSQLRRATTITAPVSLR